MAPKKIRTTQYLLPTRSADGAQWPGLIVRETNDAGKGLFATIDLPKGTAIPYYGVLIDNRSPKVGKSNYLFELSLTRFIDADPNYEPRDGIGGKGLFVAGLINEPRKGSTANCNVYINSSRIKATGWRVHIVTNRAIQRGEELTWWYGPHYYTRDYPVGTSAQWHRV